MIDGRDGVFHRRIPVMTSGAFGFRDYASRHWTVGARSSFTYYHRLILNMIWARRQVHRTCSSVEAKETEGLPILGTPFGGPSEEGSSIVFDLVGLLLSAGGFSVGNLILTFPRGLHLGFSSRQYRSSSGCKWQ